MKKDMKELIKQYKAGANTDVIQKVLAYIEQDLSQYKEGKFEKVDGLIFIAYRIRAFLLKSCFEKLRLKRLYNQSEQDKEDYDALFGEGSWISDMADRDWLNVDVNEVFEYNYQSIYANEEAIRDYYGAKSHDLFYLIKKFDLANQNTDEFRAEWESVKDELLSYFVKGLIYALTKVDTAKTDKEIVKFVNRAMLTKFVEVQMEATGTKRVRVDGKSHYIKPVFEEDAESKVWMMLIGKSLAYIGADSVDGHLTKSQKVLLMDVLGAVLAKYKDEDVEFFHWDVNGKAYLNKRKVAVMLGLSEANFKQKLKRIEEKIHGNWRVIRDNKAS